MTATFCFVLETHESYSLLQGNAMTATLLCHCIASNALCTHTHNGMNRCVNLM